MGEPITVYGTDGTALIVHGAAHLAELLASGKWSLDQPEAEKPVTKAKAEDKKPTGKK
jgi:hypothetical protein